MLQKYFPVLGEVNSPLAALAALNFTAASAEVAIKGISNEVLEALLWASVEETEARKQEIEISVSELEKARSIAAKQVKALRYRAACAARKARAISKASRQIKAARRPISSKATLRSLSGLSLEDCRQRATTHQSAIRTAVNSYNAALEAVELAVNKGGDVRTIRSKVAALKEAVRTLEVRHIEFKFAREMLSIALARHSA